MTSKEIMQLRSAADRLWMEVEAGFYREIMEMARPGDRSAEADELPVIIARLVAAEITCRQEERRRNNELEEGDW